MSRLPDPSESEFRQTVIDTLRWNGYLACATRVSKGVIIGDVGIPDVVAVHRHTGALVFVELKVAGRQPTKEQHAWIDALSILAPGRGLVGVVTPQSWRDHELEVIQRMARGQIVSRAVDGD